MKFKITKIATSVSCVLGVLTLMMGSVGVQAAVSSPTDTIEGRVPTAEGTLFVADQTGATVGTTPENSIVNREHTPNSFKASTDTTDLTLLDVDGDCDLPRGPCTAEVDVASTTKVWKYEGHVITPTQLTSPFKTYFAGKALTVTVTAPVETTTTTGAPIVGTNPLSSEETTVVVPVVPGIYVGAYPGTYRWEVADEFPTTAALGLKFTIYLADGNGVEQTDYNWTTNQSSWTSVSSDGLVTITAAPTSATKIVTITATNKINPLLKTEYTFTVNKWFDVVRVTTKPYLRPADITADVDAKCSAGFPGMKAALLSETQGAGHSGAGWRQVPGAISQEWGVFDPPSGWSGKNTLAGFSQEATALIGKGDASSYSWTSAAATPSPAGLETVLSAWPYGSIRSTTLGSIDVDGWGKAYAWPVPAVVGSVYISDGPFDLACVKHL